MNFSSYFVCVSLSLCLSGAGSPLSSPSERVLPLLRVRLTSWGHVDLFYPLSGITIIFVHSCQWCRKLAPLTLSSAGFLVITSWLTRSCKTDTPPPTCLNPHQHPFLSVIVLLYVSQHSGSASVGLHLFNKHVFLMQPLLNQQVSDGTSAAYYSAYYSLL